MQMGNLCPPFQILCLDLPLGVWMGCRSSSLSIAPVSVVVVVIGGQGVWRGTGKGSVTLVLTCLKSGFGRQLQ